MLKRLQQLNTDYSAVLKTANAEGSSVKARRQAEYQRGINKIQELLKKVEAGKPIDEAEIPVAIPASAPPVQPKPTTLPPPIAPRKPSPPTTQKNASAADTPSGPPPPPPHKPVTPPVPSHKPPTTGSESSSSTTKLPTPPEQVLHAAEQNAQQPTTGSRKLDLNQIKSLLKTRRDAYISNAQLANSVCFEIDTCKYFMSDGNKTAAYEYYTVAKQFDAAIEAVKNGEVTECDEDELPPAPTPYQAQKKAAIPSAPKTLLEGLQQRMEKYKSICDQCKHDNNDRKFRFVSFCGWFFGDLDRRLEFVAMFYVSRAGLNKMKLLTIVMDDSLKLD
ncbi:unnamed protein product [Anisakis simplex]|uniref:WH2 domain-containing protein n=1 Tax=Anisakis simplex TaxID=6269 RepID=A0A0M3J6Z4_ANISI|nr:unnamed protein product [Anisakis simplex]